MREYEYLKQYCDVVVKEIHDPKFRPSKATTKTTFKPNTLKKFVSRITGKEIKEEYVISYREPSPDEGLMIHALTYVFDKIGSDKQLSDSLQFEPIHRKFIEEYAFTYPKFDQLENPDYVLDERELFSRILHLWLVVGGLVSYENYPRVTTMDGLCIDFYKENYKEINSYLEDQFPELKGLMNPYRK